MGKKDEIFGKRRMICKVERIIWKAKDLNNDML